jgi:hypothetical protein
MNNILTKVSAIAATSAALSVAVAFSANNPAQAITFNYSFQTNTGYSGTGQFSYDELTAPPIISESGPGPTDALKFLSLSVFNPAGNLLDSGNSVVNGISTDDFLLFEFNTLTQTLISLDNNTAASGNNPYYFISNAVDPNYIFVGAGNTDFNLFAFSPSPSPGGATFLGSTTSIKVATVPEPTSALSLLALGAIGVGSALKKKKGE